jgi:CubicO group peptidase (beta-lactamase class C family)
MPPCGTTPHVRRVPLVGDPSDGRLRARIVLSLGVGLFLPTACGQGDQSRPGFPRTSREPLADAPFEYASAAEVGLSEDSLWRFKERLYSRVVARHLIGGEILVIKNGHVVLHQALGWADRERLIPLERNSIYRIASMTKPIAGTAALMLVEEGRLGLDDPVADHLPSFDNERSRAITVRHLLTHRSGFVQGGHPRGYRESESLRDAVDLLGRTGPSFPPGDEFIYSGLNTDVLGALVAELSGVPVERVLDERILTPLGLRDTYTRFSPDSAWAPRVASSYHRWSGPWEKYWTPTRDNDSGWFSPAGGLYASAFDYARFLSAWMNGGQYEGVRLLADSTVRSALTDPLPGPPRSRYYGLHWEVYAAPGAPGALPVFGHRGSTGTLGLAFPEQDVIVIFLTQSEENDVVDEVLAAAIDMFLPPVADSTASAGDAKP